MSAIVAPTKRSLLVYPTSYEPREQWSPSGLSTGDGCEMAWFLRYVLGIKEADLRSWEEVAHLERPKKPEEGYTTALEEAQHRARVKEYNRLTRRALGHAVHDILARHFDWHPPHALIDWYARPGLVAIEALHYLPAPEECGTIGVEAELEMFWGPDEDPLRIWGFADLIVRLGAPLEFELSPKNEAGPAVLGVLMPGVWLLVDYKSTYNFDNVPLASELVADVAANFYALAIMVRENLDELRCRWVYVRTDEEKPEASQKVDFTITREGALAVLAPYEALALRLREKLRLAKDSPMYAAKLSMQNPAACDKYGRPGVPNCLHHKANGGKCNPPRLTASQAIKTNIERDALLQARRDAQRERPKVPRARKGAIAVCRADTPRAALSAHHQPRAVNESTGNIMGRFSAERQAAAAANGGAAATAPADSGAGGATPPAAARAPRAPRAAAAAKPAASAAAGALPALSLQVEGGPSIPLPVGSDLHTRACKLVDVLFPAE